jgi:RimJ/RimL family protein N-acetyltransferase
MTRQTAMITNGVQIDQSRPQFGAQPEKRILKMIQTPFHLKVTDEIELRLIEEQHAQEILDLTDTNRQHLRKWLPWVDQTRSVTDTSAFIASCSRQFSENGGFQVVICFKDHLCGMIGHPGIDRPNRSTSMGYWLDASHQGKGIMTASCRVMIIMLSGTLICIALSFIAPRRITVAVQSPSV